MIFISAGFDGHYEDDMGGLKLLEKDFAWCTDQLKKLAAELSEKRIVSMLEGRLCDDLAGPQRRRSFACSPISKAHSFRKRWR
jgi:acetoin utilization deacetylase AcuC-like enzyme